MVNKKMSRREFLRAAALAGGSGILSACAPAAAPAPTQPPAAEPTAVPPTATSEPTPESWGEMTEAEATAAAEAALKVTPAADKTVIELLSVYGEVLTNETQPHYVVNKEYEALHPDQYIKYVPSSMFTGAFNEVLLARIASGDPPDLVLHWSSPIAIAARGACMELDDLMAAHPVANKDAFYAGPLSTCNWLGKQWGLTVNASECCTYADTDMMEERGISTKREDFPTTWDGLKELSAKFVKWDGDTMKLAGATPWFANWAWPSLVECNGAKFYDGTTNKYSINDERIAEMLEYWLNWIDEQYKGDYDLLKQQSADWGTYPESAFALNLQALPTDGLWSLTHIPYEKHYEIYKMPVGPSGTESRTSVWPNFMFIPVGSKHVQEAFEVIAYYCTEGMIAWFDRWSDFPAWKDFPKEHAPAELIARVGKEKALELTAFGLDYIGAAVEQWNSPVDDFAIDQINRAFDQVLHKATEPMEALEEAHKLSQAKLDEVMESA